MHACCGGVPPSLSLSLATSTTPASTPEPSAFYQPFCEKAYPEEVATRSAVHKLWRQPLPVDLEGSPNGALNQ